MTAGMTAIMTSQTAGQRLIQVLRDLNIKMRNGCQQGDFYRYVMQLDEKGLKENRERILDISVPVFVVYDREALGDLIDWVCTPQL